MGRKSGFVSISGCYFALRLDRRRDMAKEKIYSIAEAAKFLGVTRQTIAAAIDQKRLKAKKGAFVVERVVKTKVRGWVISEAELKAYRVSEQHQEAGKKNE